MVLEATAIAHLRLVAEFIPEQRRGAVLNHFFGAELGAELLPSSDTTAGRGKPDRVGLRMPLEGQPSALAKDSPWHEMARLVAPSEPLSGEEMIDLSFKAAVATLLTKVAGFSLEESLERVHMLPSHQSVADLLEGLFEKLMADRKR